MNEILIQQAQKALKSGQKTEARRLLQTAVRQNPRDYAAWLMLAGVTNSPQTALRYVEQAEKLNPTSPTVKKARAWAEGRVQEEPTTADVSPPLPSPPPAPTVAETPAPELNWRRTLIWAVVGITAVILLVLIAFFAWQTFGPQSENMIADTTMTEPIATSTPMSPTSTTAADLSANLESKTAVTAATPTPHIQPKQINANRNGDNSKPRPTWTLTPTPTNTPTPTPTLMPTFLAPLEGPISRPLGIGPKERWVDVNLTSQTLTALEGDIPLLISKISSGTSQHPTVTGQFRIYMRYESQTMDGRTLGYDYYLPNVPFVMYFYQDYALHGTFWHSNFGNPMSHGCVNMYTPDAGWLFEWAGIGTLVNVHY